MEKISNREVLEKIAKDVLKLKTDEEIDAFVKTLVYSSFITT